MDISVFYKIKCILYFLLRPIPDRVYISVLYLLKFHTLPNLQTPQNYNEKIQWLKLNDHNLLYTLLVDKYLVKNYVSHLVGKEYVIPTLGVWHNPRDIDFSTLPNKFVLKWNHDSGSSIICRDKSLFCSKSAISHLAFGKIHNGYNYGREWQYKNISPMIIAEPYLEPFDGSELLNYRFYFFSGDLKAIAVDRRNHKGSYRYLNYKGYILAIEDSLFFEIPIELDEMIRVSTILASTIIHIRIDLYLCDGLIFFSEFTLHDSSGFEHFSPPEFNEIFGSWLLLPSDINR